MTDPGKSKAISMAYELADSGEYIDAEEIERKLAADGIRIRGGFGWTLTYQLNQYCASARRGRERGPAAEYEQLLYRLLNNKLTLEEFDAARARAVELAEQLEADHAAAFPGHASGYAEDLQKIERRRAGLAAWSALK